jgi:hypothetical protein
LIATIGSIRTTIRPNVVITCDYPSLLSAPDHPVNASPTAMAEIGAGMAPYWTQLEAAGISVPQASMIGIEGPGFTYLCSGPGDGGAYDPGWP